MRILHRVARSYCTRGIPIWRVCTGAVFPDAQKHPGVGQQVVSIEVGRIQLPEGMQQQLVDVGRLLCQHREHLHPHGGLVVVGAQQLLELGVAHR